MLYRIEFMRVSLYMCVFSWKNSELRFERETERKENMFTYMSFSLLFGFYETHAMNEFIHHKKNTICNKLLLLPIILSRFVSFHLTAFEMP